jgi:hypothetical protein
MVDEREININMNMVFKGGCSLDEESIARALSKLFWGKKGEGKRFSMKKLVFDILKKRLSRK